MKLEKLTIQQLQNEIWSYNNGLVPAGGLPVENYQEELKRRKIQKLLNKIKEMKKMTYIKVYNDGNLVFTGPAAEWVENNEQDDEVIEMVEEVEAIGKSERKFISGEWLVITA